MKKISKIPLGFVLGILVSLTINVTAETLIDSGAVSYSNSNTSETTVGGALDELFSAIEISNQIGDMTKIASIGDGTIAGAINTVNSEVANKANLSHNHDDRYYTESEVNTKLSSIATIKSVSRTGSTSSHGNVKLSVPGTPIHAICTNRSDIVIVPYTISSGNVWWFHAIQDSGGSVSGLTLNVTIYYI